MGATVSVAKMAAAFKANNGKVGFALFEQTYEKNCYPHTPKWSCLAIGTREDVLRMIFLCAASFEDGLLQTRTGERSTEAFISEWLGELAMPFDLQDKQIELRIGDDWQAPIPATDIYNKDRRPKIDQALRSAGYSGAADTLGAGQTLAVSLYQDLDLLRTLFAVPQGANSALCGSWRILSHKDAGQSIARTLGIPRAKPRGATLTLPRLLKVQSPNRSVDAMLVQQDGGHYAISWRSFIDVSIAGICVEAEIKYPGSYDANIKAVRAAVKAAQHVDALTKVEYRHEWIPSESMGWMPRDLNKLAAEFGAQPQTAFSTTWGEILDKDHASSHSLAWEMTRLTCSRWYPTETTDLFSPQNDAVAKVAA